MSKITLIILVLLFSGNAVFAQDHSMSLAAADTTNFSVNKIEAWKLFNSYVSAYSNDSVLVELILMHDRAIDWGQEQEVGKIKPDSLFPETDRIFSFKLLLSIHQLRIARNGKCYLRLDSGALPKGDPIVVPLRGIYKK